MNKKVIAKAAHPMMNANQKKTVRKKKNKKPVMYRIRVVKSNGEFFFTYSTMGSPIKEIVIYATRDKYNHPAWIGFTSTLKTSSVFDKRFASLDIDGFIKKQKEKKKINKKDS